MLIRSLTLSAIKNSALKVMYNNQSKLNGSVRLESFRLFLKRRLALACLL